MNRRNLLGSLSALGWPWPVGAQALTSPPAPQTATRQRVVVLGGGWAGLSFARELGRLAPHIDIVLLDREPVLRSLPLSNPWLVGRTPERLPAIDLAALGATLGFRFVQAEALAIDRAQRQVHTSQGSFAYDWLMLANGIAYDYTPWFGQDLQAAAHSRTQFPGGFIASELDLLKRQLDLFQGGDLVMTIPPTPYRCPPAPYERAMLMAWMLKTRRIPGKLTVLDAGAGLPRFTRLFAERYPQHIVYRPHSSGLTIDPFARRIGTDEGEIRFEHAILLPPMRASQLLAQAGLLGVNAQGQTTPWAEVDPLRLCSLKDDRVYLAGDLLGAVSPLFGHYPKTAHIATRLGAAAAQQVAAHSQGLKPPPVGLPESICHVWLDADPAEQLRIEATYRLRGDGVIAQAVRQFDNPQPRDEDLKWGQTLYAEQLGVPRS
jgi:NADPH-dependent 2,4-dienoyl-CoA reductase/sulfur reductase-like enzyme